MKKIPKIYFIVPLILQCIAWVPTVILLKIFANFKVYGKENLKGLSGPIIFAANHTNELDPILVTAALPLFSRFSPLFYLARESKYYKHDDFGWRKYIYGGLFFKAWGAYPVHSGLKDYEKSLENHIAILKDGGSICIFPEGRRSEDGSVAKAHGGVIFLNNSTKTKIIPVHIRGAFGMSLKKFFNASTRIIIDFRPPYNPSIKVDVENYSEEADKLMLILTKSSQMK